MQVWNETFAKWLGPIPAAMHGPCCAEFIVSRERIMAHPRYTAHTPSEASMTINVASGSQVSINMHFEQLGPGSAS